MFYTYLIVFNFLFLIVCIYYFTMCILWFDARTSRTYEMVFISMSNQIIKSQFIFGAVSERFGLGQATCLAGKRVLYIYMVLFTHSHLSSSPVTIGCLIQLTFIDQPCCFIEIACQHLLTMSPWPEWRIAARGQMRWPSVVFAVVPSYLFA